MAGIKAKPFGLPEALVAEVDRGQKGSPEHSNTRTGEKDYKLPLLPLGYRPLGPVGFDAPPGRALRGRIGRAWGERVGVLVWVTEFTSLTAHAVVVVVR